MAGRRLGVRLTAGAVVLVAAAGFTAPMWMGARGPVMDTEKEFSRQGVARGPYLNSGSRDVGPNVDWDVSRRAFTGGRHREGGSAPGGARGAEGERGAPAPAPTCPARLPAEGVRERRGGSET